MTAVEQPQPSDGDVRHLRTVHFRQEDWLDALPPDVVRNDVVAFIRAYIDQARHGRGPFHLRDQAQTQQLPGLTVPTWLAMLLNQLTMDPRLPYNSDRPAMLRDFLVLAAAGVFQVLAEVDPDDTSVRNATHIIRHEESLRREAYSEELMLGYAEDLASAARMLELKMAAGNRDAVFADLRRLFHHVSQVTDRAFWRPTLQRMLIGTPEVEAAMMWLGEDESYRRTLDFQSWVAIREMHRA